MSKLLIAAAVAFGSATAASAQDVPGPQGPIARADYQAVQSRQFTTLDADGDGTVTRAELAAMLTQRAPNTPAATIDIMFRMLDSDGDGKAGAAEVDAGAMARFDLWDSNHDGMLSAEERRVGAMAMMRQMQAPR